MMHLFLDIDGVLNRYYLNLGCIIIQGTPERWRSCIGMDRYLVDNLNSVLDTVEMKIVISSSWMYNKNTLRALKHFGFTHLDKIVGGTYKRLSGRGNQIIEYLDEHGINDFVIVDDEVNDIVGDHESVTNEVRNRLSPYVLKTNMYQGLTEDKCIELLNLIGEDNEKTKRIQPD